ncbi:Crp/Fnr family transcriptional regulator [uncultured Lactobacillus sp.]|uniref:Crp/Fnr family transcriptional regulator n=1 Tax=uncultured Lactobacillus sp. TaxID=153152 RepID=UPI00261BE637|nr:Crp/Fnr family transcriptional regulator [uncultured Lactobacillus sp.]
MTHSPVACISKATIFNNLPVKMIEKLVPISTHQEYFPKGSIIRQPGDGKDGMIFLDQGSAKIYSINEDGKETVLGILNKGDADGQQNLFRDNIQENFIEALQDTYVCSIERQDFQKLLKRTPDLALNLLNSFGEQLVIIETNSIRRNSMNAQERIVAYLKDLSKKQGSNVIELKLKKKDLASYLGITPETLSRKLKKLQKENRIKISGRRIILL